MKLLCVIAVLCALWGTINAEPPLAPWPVVLGINDYQGKGASAVFSHDKLYIVSNYDGDDVIESLERHPDTGAFFWDENAQPEWTASSDIFPKSLVGSNDGKNLYLATDDGIKMFQISSTGAVQSIGTLSTYVRKHLVVPSADDFTVVGAEIIDEVPWVSWFVRNEDTGALDYPDFYYSADQPGYLPSGSYEYGVAVSPDATAVIHSASPTFTFTWRVDSDGIWYAAIDWNSTWTETDEAAISMDPETTYVFGTQESGYSETFNDNLSPYNLVTFTPCGTGDDVHSLLLHPDGGFVYSLCDDEGNTELGISTRISGYIEAYDQLDLGLSNSQISASAIDPRGGTIVWIDSANDKIITVGIFAPPKGVSLDPKTLKPSDAEQRVTVVVDDPDPSDWFDIEIAEDTKAAPVFTVEGDEIIIPAGTALGKYQIIVRVTDFAGFVLEQSVTLEIKEDSSSFPKWAIIVIAVGGGVLASCMILVIVLLISKRRNQKRQHPVELEDLHVANAGSKLTQIPESELKVQEKIGGGAFGDVFKGLYLESVPVALKKLTNVSAAEFEQEAVILQDLKHPNIVQFLGICTTSACQWMVTEFMSKGSLLDLLRKGRLDVKDLLFASLDVAAGMAYLESKNTIHRDLGIQFALTLLTVPAARNLLVAPVSDSKKKYVVKVADFGMSRAVKPEAVYESQSDKFPVKWSSPEVLNFRTYTIKSDVWAFGVTLWEIFSRGRMPYGEMSNKEAASFVTGGGRLDQPDCPEEVYKVMLECWREDPASRPDFKEIFGKLSDLVATADQTMLSNNNNDSDSLYSYDISRASQATVSVSPPKQDYHNDP